MDWFRTIKGKLIFIFLFIVIIPISIMSFIAMDLIMKGIRREAQERIISDLNVAVAIYDKIKNQLKYTASDQNRRIYYYIENEAVEALPEFLKAIAEQNSLDVFLVTDKNGRVIAQANRSLPLGDNLAKDELVKRTLGGETVVTTELVSETELKREGLINKVSPEGMMIKILMPVRNIEDNVIGAMVVGYLLNSKNEIVDIISSLIGVQAAIFQEDQIISSSLKNKSGDRIIGTKTSRYIANQVLKQGQIFIGEDVITKGGYLTGYVPLRNYKDKVIGSLYVRTSEAGFITIRNKMRNTIGYLAVFSMLFALIVSFSVASPITQSITHLKKGAEMVASGNFDQQINVATNDELKDLAVAFNEMTADLKEAQQKLIQSEKMAALGQIAAAVSHELKNPLTGIKMAAYNLNERLTNRDSEITKSLIDIDTEIERANKIIMEILTFSQPISPIFTSVNINDIVLSVMPLMEKEAQAHSVQITKNLSSGISLAYADGDQMKQVLENLMSNAIQAMPKGGVLTVTTQRVDEQIKIEVSDTGVGINEEDLKNIFAPFFTTKSKGIGLGLSIVSEIIRKHQGTIEVKSQVGQGTTFTIMLPKAKYENM